MLNIISGIVLALFYAYVILTFTSAVSLILNIFIITTLYFLITRDVKDPDNHKYYIISLFLTALFFIFSYTALIKSILSLSERLLISLAAVAGLLVYIFSQLMSLVIELYRHIKRKNEI